MLSHRKPEPPTEKPDLSQRGQADKREGGPLQRGRPIQRGALSDRGWTSHRETGCLCERPELSVRGFSQRSLLASKTDIRIFYREPITSFPKSLGLIWLIWINI